MPTRPSRAKRRRPNALAVDRERVIEELLTRAPVRSRIDRRRDSDIQAFIDLLVTRTLTQYHAGLLREAYEEGYQRGVADGRHAMASLRDLESLRRELDGRVAAASPRRRVRA